MKKTKLSVLLGSLIVFLIGAKIILEVMDKIGVVDDTPAIGLLIALASICLGFVIKNMEQKKKKVERMAQSREEGMIVCVDAKHMKGLEIHKWWSCELQFFKEKMTMFREDGSFTVPVESMKRIVWVREEELEKLYLTEQGALEGGIFFDSVEKLQESSRKRISEYIIVIVYQRKDLKTYHFIAFDVAGKEREVEDMIKGTWVLE